MNARTLAAAALVLATAQGAAQGESAPPTDTAFSGAVQRLLVATGARTNMHIVIDGMIDVYRRNLPQVPAQMWEEMRKSFDVDTLIAMEIPIYQKYLTLDEVRAIANFYETPIGKKLISVQPMILQESMAVGRAWGEQVGRQIMEKLKAQGYTKSS
jgi:hypothetical protein